MVRAARQTAWHQCACSTVTLASASLAAPDPAPQANHLVKDLHSRIHPATVKQQVEGDLVALALAWVPKSGGQCLGQCLRKRLCVFVWVACR
eukprot:scaffold132920_cov17-Tisochrysis_lutea.AAC.1